MFIDSVTYLLEVYWPFALGALGVGVVTGWLSVPMRKG